jgi:hypothetical protein
MKNKQEKFKSNVIKNGVVSLCFHPVHILILTQNGDDSDSSVDLNNSKNDLKSQGMKFLNRVDFSNRGNKCSERLSLQVRTKEIQTHK